MVWWLYANRNCNHAACCLYAKICKNPKDYLTCGKPYSIYSFAHGRFRSYVPICSFWIKDPRSYHCVMKSVPMVKIGAEVRLTSVPFRLLSVPFISIPPNRGGSNLQSYCAFSSSIPSHLSDILKDRNKIKILNIRIFAKTFSFKLTCF